VAVAEQCRRRGYGQRLVGACIEDARTLGVATLFCLTYQPAFFHSLGFREVDRGTLPRKVWSECIRCPKFNHCTEIAMTLQVLETLTPAPEDPLISLATVPTRHGR